MSRKTVKKCQASKMVVSSIFLKPREINHEKTSRAMTGRVWTAVLPQGTPGVMGVMGAFFSRILHLLAELERPVRILQADPSSLPVISPSDPSAPNPAFPTAGLPGGCRDGRTSGKVELPQQTSVGLSCWDFNSFSNFAFNYYSKILVSYFNEQSNYSVLFTLESTASITEVTEKIFGDRINEWSFCRKLGLMRPLRGTAPD